MGKDKDDDFTVLKLLDDNISEIKLDVKAQSAKITSIETTLVRLTESVEHHVKRTDLLEEMVKPLHEARIKEEGISEYKKQQRKLLLERLKLPGYIAASGAAVMAILHFLMKVL